MGINKITKLVSKLVVVSLISSVNILSIQEAAFSNTFKITFKEGPLDIKCPTIYVDTDNLNLEAFKAETCSNINVEELEGELGSVGSLDYKVYDPYNKRGVLVDVLLPSNNV